MCNLTPTLSGKPRLRLGGEGLLMENASRFTARIRVVAEAVNGT